MPKKVFVEADGPEGDALQRYWGSTGMIAPYRVGRGLYYQLSEDDPAGKIGRGKNSY
jgi:hypothetical protein